MSTLNAPAIDDTSQKARKLLSTLARGPHDLRLSTLVRIRKRLDLLANVCDEAIRLYPDYLVERDAGAVK